MGALGGIGVECPSHGQRMSWTNESACCGDLWRIPVHFGSRYGVGGQNLLVLESSVRLGLVCLYKGHSSISSRDA